MDESVAEDLAFLVALGFAEGAYTAAVRGGGPAFTACLPTGGGGEEFLRVAELDGERLSGQVPFAAECEGWAGRPDTYKDFNALLHEWGNVTTEAARHGLGLVGLP
ncbi:hypothetical protein OG413_39255 [Streptomyces sp. NBC_01433]|uniref:hypothetical protein n=1 Tax=Streptomyces sp. NBC_01433 TaxID=2903864 RepID=UPI00225B1ED5|nr:hypothetical protein [Streptomyces sp. NBC_01433]MCX4681243.1 hypothetical protein [Streptomyces sp. NBC_01433]